MKLVYYNFCPFSRSLRIALIEKKIPFSLDIINPWESQQDEVIVSPASNIPAIYDEIDDHKFPIMSALAGYEYLEDAYHDISLYGDDVLIRAEIRRIIAWMDQDFFTNTTSKLIEQKIINRSLKSKSPNSKAIIDAFESLPYYLEYVDFLTGKRKWLAGDEFSMADIVAGSHISIIDYLGDVDWKNYPNLKEWYTKLKSRPSFRETLADRIGTIRPSESYGNLDF
jgi:glutathione S-transferase